MGGHRLPLLQPTLTARAPLRAAVFGNLDLGNLQGWPRDIQSLHLQGWPRPYHRVLNLILNLMN